MIEPETETRFARQLAAMIRAAGADDPETFAIVVGMLDDAREQLPAAAQELRSQGYSYTDLGRALGVHRSAARQRFGRLVEAVHRSPALKLFVRPAEADTPTEGDRHAGNPIAA